MNGLLLVGGAGVSVVSDGAAVGAPSAISKGGSAAAVCTGAGVGALALFSSEGTAFSWDEVATGISETAGGAGMTGGAGIAPVTLLSWDTNVTGTSTIFVAMTTIPFFRPNASTICPFTVNF